MKQEYNTPCMKKDIDALQTETEDTQEEIISIKERIDKLERKYKQRICKLEMQIKILQQIVTDLL